MTKRESIIASRAKRPAGEGPQRAKRPLLIEDVDTQRRLGCAKYEGCLGEMAIVGCRGWTCPKTCSWFKPSAPAELDWRSDEPYYTTGPTGSTGHGAGED